MNLLTEVVRIFVASVRAGNVFNLENKGANQLLCSYKQTVASFLFKMLLVCMSMDG
jgi:hypothetical protein